jgi:hypothetical protein
MKNVIKEDNSYKGYLPKTAEENYQFNTKRTIPADKQVGFKDGNPKNIAFANLILEPKKPEIKEEPKKEAKEEPKKEEPKTKK